MLELRNGRVNVSLHSDMLPGGSIESLRGSGFRFLYLVRTQFPISHTTQVELWLWLTQNCQG